jgi:hypothetical protein
MKFLGPAIVLLSLLSGFAPKVVVAQNPLVHPDDYGAIRWNDEKARLDNFAIQLLNDQSVTGYILIVAPFDGCPGEAQARAIRAKRYLVEHGKVPWNRVIWRLEGYWTDLSTLPLLLPRETSPPYPLRYVNPGKDGPLTKECRTRLRQIARSLPALPHKASHR